MWLCPTFPLGHNHIPVRSISGLPWLDTVVGLLADFGVGSHTAAVVFSSVPRSKVGRAPGALSWRRRLSVRWRSSASRWTRRGRRSLIRLAAVGRLEETWDRGLRGILQRQGELRQGVEEVLRLAGVLVNRTTKLVV
jgi:hypothetical protein